jgi:biotin-(acetyl-CoA carboxylase) ligase
VLAALAERYRQLTSGACERVISDWRSYGSDMFGRVVECTVGGRMLAGVAEDINEQGALLVRTASQLLPVTSGQVTWK